MNVRRFITLLVTLLSVLAPLRAGAERLLTDKEVDELARPLVEQEWCVGLVVGLIDKEGQRVFGFGKLSSTDPTTPDGDTFFEIGSVTKTFTGVLLAEMVGRGEVALDDPVAKHLPPDVKVPQVGERPITLVDLATHRSGLPRMPDNFKPADWANPYADYTVEQMYAFLGSCKPARPPGKAFEYSNFGMGLLGHVLVRRADAKDYKALLGERVLRPLGMTDTRVTINDETSKKRFARGHNADGEPVANWDLPTLAGAGAIRSTANDLLKFLAAHLDASDKTALGKSMLLAMTPQAGTTSPSMGLGWGLHPKNGIISHGGATAGYVSFCAIKPSEHFGVVVLANNANGMAEQLGMRLGLRMEAKKIDPMPLRKLVEVPDDVLDKRVGRYVLPLLLDLTVTREGHRLLAQIPGQQKFRIYPESDTSFFYKAVNAQITFTLDKSGRAYVATLHQNGAKLPALRADGKPTSLPTKAVD